MFYIVFDTKIINIYVAKIHTKHKKLFLIPLNMRVNQI